jgi:hypothetical protein
MAFKFVMRGLKQPAGAAGVKRLDSENPAEGLAELLALKGFPAPEPLISWKDNEGALSQLAALDVDWHGKDKPRPQDLDTLAGTCIPCPAFSWRTHGGGLRLIYVATDKFTAEELAGIAAASLFKNRRSYLCTGVTGMEIKAETRHPGYPKADGSTCGSVHRSCNGFDARLACDVLLGREADIDPDIVDEWLEEQCLEQFRSYEHDRCPLNPAYPSHGKPVFIGDYGIFCHSCDGRGTGGFIPWVRLLDPTRVAYKRNALREAVRGLAHWEHAQHVLRAELPYLPEKLARPAYHALLKLCHLPKAKNDKHREGLTKLIDKAFFPPLPVVRSHGCWVHHDDLATPYKDKPLEKLLPCLPAVQYADKETGELKGDRRKLGIFQSDADLTEHGYPPVEPLRGCDLRGAGWAEDDEADVVLAVVPAKRAPFRYIPRDEREIGRTREKAESELTDQFPGVNLPLLKLLIAAKGFGQRRPIEPPMVMLTGQSSAGKTATVLLAAELSCDSAAISKFTGSTDEFMRSVGAACGRQSFLLLDEIAKGKASAGDLEAALLSVKRGALYRELYVGFRPFGVLPALVMADTVLPAVMRNSVQLARRIVHVDLGAGSNEGADWRTTCWGGEIEGWRSRVSWHADAANWLVSEVLNECMRFATFHMAAEALGFPTLAKGRADGIDPHADLRDLFDAACEAPDAKGSHWKGQGWKVFDPQSQTKLAVAWSNCLVGCL